MSYYKRKFPKSLFYVLLILFVAFLSIFGLFRMFGFTPFLSIENITIRTFQPVIKAIRHSGSFIQKRTSLLMNLSSIQKRIDELEYQIRLDKVQNALNNNLITENEALKNWLGLIKESDYLIEVADILYHDLDLPYNFIVSKGSKDKIQKDNPVVLIVKIGPAKIIKLCLVGKIDQVNQNNAHVLSILDRKLKVNAKNMRTGVNGTVFYDPKEKKLYFETLRFDKDMQLGDLIVTNELSFFPKGLLIGSIKSEEEVAINNKLVLELPFDILAPSQVGIMLP